MYHQRSQFYRLRVGRIEFYKKAIAESPKSILEPTRCDTCRRPRRSREKDVAGTVCGALGRGLAIIVCAAVISSSQPCAGGVKLYQKGICISSGVCRLQRSRTCNA